MTPSADRCKIALHAHYATQKTPYRVFHELLCGPQGSCRIDTWVLHVTWTRYEALAFEVKTSHQDFLRDVHDGKWRSYLDHCSHFYFASPRDVIKTTEVPEGCGLVWCGDGESLRFVRRAVAREWKPNFVMLLALLFDLDTPIRSFRESTYQLRMLINHPESRRLMSVAELNRLRATLDGQRARRDIGFEVAKTISEAREVLRKANDRVTRADKMHDLLYRVGQVLGVRTSGLPEYADRFMQDVERVANEVPTMRDVDALRAAHATLGRVLSKVDTGPREE